MTQEEFENIIPRLRPQMVKVGRDFFGNQMDAEDVAQESLIRLWKYCERLNVSQNIEALAIKVAKNICIDLYKKRKQTTELKEDTQTLTTESADSLVQQKETQGEIDNAMNRLNPRERELFTARQDGKSAEEISRDTGIPKASVKSMVSMAKKKLIIDLQKHLRR